MYRIKEECSHTIEIEKSKFITYLKRVFSEEEARDYITHIQKLHPTATHHCTAFIIGEHDEIQRSSDNGEPSGTAGIPMLEALKKNHIQDIVAVTVRYFGGIKLGTGGLVRAYSKSVSLALKEAATLTRKVNVNCYSISFPYDLIGKLDYYFKEHGITVTEKRYESEVTYDFYTILSCQEDIAEITSGKYLPIALGTQLMEEEVKLSNEE